MSRFVLTAQLQLQAPNNVSQVVRQIQNQLNGVTVNVQVQGSAQAQRQIQQITNQTNQCTSAATRMGKAFAVSIRRFAAFSIATRAVGLFTSTLSDAIQTSIDFERQLIKVSQVTGKSVSELSGLTGEITRLSTSLGVSSQSLLDVSTILAQAGLTADDTKTALNSLARAALAPNFDSITETAEGAIAILAQFKEGVGALEGQLGSINAVAGAFAVEASDLIDVIRRTGGVFKSSGGSLNELLALFTSVRATTRESAESIGTGLRTIFTRIQRPKTIEYLKRFGVELVDLEGKFVGPFEAVRRLSTALSGLGEGDITFIGIAEELGGFRQIGKVLPLLQQFATAQAALNVATNAGNSLSSDAASAQAALAVRIMKVKEEFLALVRSITETSTFQVMATTALQLASALISIADAIKPLLPLLAAMAAIKIARGIGSFGGAMMGGFTSGRTFNKGGKVHAFARGGLVPGTGNRDTVPAMLSPGEFVIRKSSVNRLGAGNLAAMNENKYATGGPVVAASLPSAALKKRVKNANSKEAQEHPELFKKGYYLTDTDKIFFNKKEYGLQESSSINASAFEDRVVQAIGGSKPKSKIAPVDVIGSNKGNVEVRNRIRTTKDKVLLDKFLRQRILENKPLIPNQTQGEDLQFPDTVSVVYNTGKLSRGRFEQLNLGGLIGKFATGGLVNENSIGAAILQNVGFSSDNKVKVSRQDIEKKLPKTLKLDDQYPIKSQKTLTLQSEGLSGPTYNKFKEIIDNNLAAAAVNSAQSLGSSLGLAAKTSIPQNEIANFLSGINDGSVGNLFEDTLKVLTGPPFSTDAQRAFDFTGGLSNILKDDYKNITSKYIDAKASSKRASMGWETKVANTLALEAMSTGRARAETSEEKRVRESSELKAAFGKSSQKKHFGGLVQKFAIGGRAKGIQDAPLVDDILQASGSILPRPSMAIQALIKAGGGAVDVDRTLKRTLGDKAYGSAKTAGEKSAALDKFFRDPQARLRDVTSAPLTVFGKELQSAIKSKQLEANKLSIISKSSRVPGVAEYLNKLFGIPLGNMIFTQGGSKQPAMDALRNKGPRASRVARFATGGDVGTDTVPALLTPGEFVVNRKSAQSIGYGALHRMNKVGKYAKGGVVGPQRLFVGGVAEKQVSRDVGFRQIDSIDDAAKVMAESLKTLGPDIKKAILDKFTGIEAVSSGGKTSLGGDAFKETTRGQAVFNTSSGATAMGLQIKGKSAAANTNTVAHETGHLADSSLMGKKGFASQTQGTFQFDLVEKVKPQMEAAFKAAGKSAEQIEAYLGKNEELFAEFFAKASPEVRAIITSTTDSKVGMEKLANHLEKAGHTYAGLEASDIAVESPTAAKSPSASASSAAATAATASSPKKPAGPSSPPVNKPPIDDGVTRGYIKEMSAVVKARTQVLEQAKQEEQKTSSYSSKHANAIKALEAKLVKSSASYDGNNNIKLQQQIKYHTEKLKIADQNTEAVLVAERNLAKSVTHRAKLIDQARAEKAAATTAQRSTLQGGTPSSFNAVNAKLSDRQEAYAQVRNNRDKYTRAPLGGNMGGMMPKDIGGAAIALSMVTGSLQAMLPPLDENASAITKMSHSILGFITTVAGAVFALQSFGVELKAQAVMSFLGGGGISKRGLGSMRGGMMDMGLSRGLATQITGTVNAIAKIAGPALVAVGALYVFDQTLRGISSLIYGDFQKKKEAAIQTGDIEGAGKYARAQSGQDTRSAAGGVGVSIGAIVGAKLGATLLGTVGAAVGSFVPVLGTALGAAAGSIIGAVIGSTLGAAVGYLVGAMSTFLPIFHDYGTEAANTAMAMAGNTKASKDLEKAQSDAAMAAEKFKNGTISASEYLAVFTQSGTSVQDNSKRVDAVTKQATEGQSTGLGMVGRNLGAYLGGGLFGMETAGTRNKRLSEEGVSAVKGQRENEGKLFQDSTEARNAAIRSTIARGGTVEDAKALVKDKTGLDSEQMKARATSLSQQAESARKGGDTKLAAELDAQSTQLSSQADQLVASFENIDKEVTRAKAAFAALNLGLRGPEATATAMSASLNKFAAGLEVGGSQFVNNTQFLSEAMSSAAQAMDAKEIQSAIKNVKDNLTKMGISQAYATKFEANTNAFVQAQQNYTKAFSNIKAKNPEFKSMSSDKLKKAFADELTVGLGVDAKKNLTAIIEGMELSQGEVDDILGGNLQVFGDKLGEAGKKQFEQIMKIAEERQKAEKVLIDLTKQRIDAERNSIEAAKQAIDLQLEGRELQGKYGGKQVTMEERRAAIVGKANAGTGLSGLSNMSQNATVGDFARRRKEIQDGFSEIEDKRRTPGGMDGAAGVQADEKQKELNSAVKDQIQTIRDLVKLEEENLKLVQEKNKLEKQSLESLVNGDIEKFFEQQAAVGATAAIATGNKELMNAFGGQALGGAYSDIQRQQEAGVQSLYGRQLAGQGGLVEQSAGAALGARGISNPLMAQQLAGTTPEEEASRARLRELGGELGNLGELGQQMAELQVETATMNVNNAQIILDKVEEKGRAAAAGMARGGVVYASRGIFVPRGTDTVPAMLTPGEFVVNRGAVNRGNNLQILQAMNGNTSPSAAASVAGGSQALSRGGSVQYLADGGILGGLLGGSIPDVISSLSQALGSFVSQMSENIKALQNTKFQVTLDSTNINVNVSGMTAGITDAVKEEIAQKVAAKIKNNYSVGQGGKLTENTSTLPKM
jgi:TP901 family phage tail tape measure protein